MVVARSSVSTASRTSVLHTCQHSRTCAYIDAVALGDVGVGLFCCLHMPSVTHFKKTPSSPWVQERAHTEMLVAAGP